MKTLIVTVGTRQVGWHCKDGVLRSLGADGVKYDPPHTTEIYRDELGIERGSHEEGDRSFQWSVWDLGKRLFQRCQETGFEPVELLLDNKLIADYVLTDQEDEKLTHVILWGTQQPEDVSWNYRRMDTAWLAELMAGKLRSLYPTVEVTVFKPVLGAIDPNAVRDQLEFTILPFALGTRQTGDENFTLLIENKGATPAIAEGLSICAGALVRDCQVVIVSPTEPRPLYPEVNETTKAVALAETYRSVNLSSYFWPLERSRIRSAWERGDFREAQLWLKAHLVQHKPLYSLAEYLALTTNWQMDDALKEIKNWIETKAVKKRTDQHTRQVWQEKVQAMRPAGNRQTAESKYLKIWETRFLIDLELRQSNYTAGFMQFAQMLERLLFWRYETEDWITSGWIVPDEDKKAYGLKYKASFGELKGAWLKMNNIEPDDERWKQLDKINERRNSVVHSSAPLTLADLAEAVGLGHSAPSSDELYRTMLGMLERLLPSDRKMPERSLLQDLYQWGLDQL
jgi:hypothetical protein